MLESNSITDNLNLELYNFISLASCFHIAKPSLIYFTARHTLTASLNGFVPCIKNDLMLYIVFNRKKKKSELPTETKPKNILILW